MYSDHKKCAHYFPIILKIARPNSSRNVMDTVKTMYLMIANKNKKFKARTMSEINRNYTSTIVILGMQTIGYLLKRNRFYSCYFITY